MKLESLTKVEIMSVITKIEFENENQVYYSGQVLKGRATLTVGEEKLLKGD